MTKKIKKSVSILLALIMLCGVLAVAPVAVGAEELPVYETSTGGKYTFDETTGILRLVSGKFTGQPFKNLSSISIKEKAKILIAEKNEENPVCLTGDCMNIFSFFTALEEANISNINIDSLKNMQGLFYQCTELKKCVFFNSDTTSVINMQGIFSGCNALKEVDFSNFYGTSNVVNMENMFAECRELTSINLINFNTRNVKYMAKMFKNCENLSSINLTNFHTGEVTEMYDMFFGCSALTSLDLSSFERKSSTTKVDNMFKGCTQLKEITISDKLGSIGTSMHLNNGVYNENIQIYNGWRLEGDPEAGNVSLYNEDAIIAAPNSETTYTWVGYYDIDWMNEGGTLLSSELYRETTNPSYKGATPTRPDSDGKTYTFDGWIDDLGNTFDKNADLPAVTRDTTYTAKFTEVPKKFFAAHSLTLDGDIGVNFFIDVTAAGITPQDILSGDSTLTLDFSWDTDPAPITDVSKDSITLSKSNASRYYNEDNGYFKIKCNVAAAEMACKIKADGIVAGAKDYTESETYSVRDYGMSVINNPSKYSETLVDLAKKMLDYGAKAQKVFNIIPDDLANKDVTGYTMTNVTASDIQAAIEAEPANKEKTASDMASGTSDFGLRYASSTVVYLTKSTLRHYYYIDDQGKYDNVKAKFNERKLPVAVYIEYSDIAAADLDKLQTFAIDSTHTYYYSALNYAKDVIGSNSSKDENKKLAMAMYWYNQAANAYFK